MLWRTRRLRCLAGLLVISFFCGMFIGIIFITSENPHSVNGDSKSNILLSKKQFSEGTAKIHPTKMESVGSESKVSKSDPTLKNQSLENRDEYPEPNYNVHAFYYHWYGNPQFDSQYFHWNHEYLPHWDKKENAKWPKGKHVPPEDIGSNYYPELGPYSSSDPQVIDKHMAQLRKAGVGVISLSWYPPDMADDSGDAGMADRMIPILLDSADTYKIKVCFHIEPYKGRNHVTLRGNISYISAKYGSHPAFYRYLRNGRNLPFFYIYDSYLISPSDLGKVFKPDGEMTVRNTDIDGVFIGLLVEAKHRTQLLEEAGLDGFYTYFASEGFSYGSKTINWNSLMAYCTSHNALFIPSVGPGYIDERVRPWNGKNSKGREEGAYYDRYWKAALGVKPPVVTITSFNEWHEGTQIESAIPKKIANFKYSDYQPHQSDYYLSLTRSWSHKYKQLMKLSP